MAKKINIAAELETIRKKGGGILRPIDVVSFALDEQTALHGCFEWEESKAAHEYRLEQARKLIRVSVTILKGRDISVRAYVSLQGDQNTSGGGYRTIVDVMGDKELRKAFLSESFAEMTRFEQKYQELKELVPVFNAMKRVKK